MSGPILLISEFWDQDKPMVTIQINGSMISEILIFENLIYLQLKIIEGFFFFFFGGVINIGFQNNWEYSTTHIIYACHVAVVTGK